MGHPAFAFQPFWLFVTRLGEAQILLPAALVLGGWLARRGEARLLVQWWLALIAAAACLTIATKVAFMGWGIGSAALNFTGVSGHAMCAAAVYPPLLRLVVSSRSRRWQFAAAGAGYALALLVAVSRIVTGAHSASEVAAGVLVGGAVSAAALLLARTRMPALPLWMPVALALWLAITPARAPVFPSHSLITKLALALSGRAEPHTRRELLRGYAQKPRQVATALE